MRPILFCPRCRKMAKASDFLDPAYLGVLDSVLPMMRCRCGYEGLPISLERDEYERLMNSKPPRKG